MTDVTGEGEDVIVEAGTLSLVYVDGEEITFNRAFPGVKGIGEKNALTSRIWFIRKYLY